jgi:hypothetical protein
VVVWGPPKCGKSFWAFDLFMHVAAGWEYRGRRVRQGGVVYLALEGGHGFQGRAEAFRLGHPELGGDPPFFLVTAAVNLIADHAALIDSIKAQHKGGAPAAVVIDTLNRSLVGSESKDVDMANYIRAADAIREAFGCVVVIIHHSGIEQGRPRGHTSLTGAVDAQIKVERDEADNILATVEWMKDGPEGAVVVSRLEPVDVGQDEDGDTISSCIIVPVEGVQPSRKADRKVRLPKSATIALRALRNALAEVGQPAPASNHVPQMATVATTDQWRDYAYRGGITSSNEARARQKAFKAGWDHLVGAGLVGAWDPYVWIVEEVANR